MKKSLFYTICLCFFFSKYTITAELDNPKLYVYLNNKHEIVQDAVLDKLKIDLEIEEGARPSHISSSYKCIFSLFNETFILLGNELYSVSPSSTTIDLKIFKILSIKSDIIFTKVTQFEDLGLILIKTETEINIYRFQSNNIFFVHSIFAPYAVDAHFFINQNSLYLIVVNNIGDNWTISTVYKWLGTYFDETNSIFTTGAVKVASFTSNFFEIIVVLQYHPQKHFFSAVYEYNFDRIKKIQHIKTTEPVHIEVFPMKPRTYVIVFEKTKNNFVYAWDGTKLVKTSQFQTETIVNKSVTLSKNGTSVLVVPIKNPHNQQELCKNDETIAYINIIKNQQNKMQAFRLLPKEVRLAGEKSFNSTYSSIIDLYRENDTKNMIYIVSLNDNNTFHISVLSIKANFSDIEILPRNKESLRDCFNSLEERVYEQKRKFTQRKKVSSQVNVGVNVDLPDSLPLTASRTIEDDSDLEQNLINLKTRVNQLQHRLTHYQDKEDNHTIINKHVIIKGSIEANNLSGKDVNITEINGKKWTPQKWLKYKESQNITGPIKITKITATELNTLDPLFSDLLMKNGNQNIRGRLKTINLTANKLLAERINDIQLNDVYLKSDQQPIQGLKTFKNLNTTETKIKLLNGLLPNKILSQFNASSRSRSFDNNLEVENLVVDTINDIHWNTFRDGVFRIGITKEINGNLNLPEFKTTRLILKTLKDVKIEDLFTTSTNQVIDADIEFANIIAKNIITNKTNDIKLSEAAVQFGNDTLVEAPVKFDKLYVPGKLELVGKLDKDLFLKDGEHIIGTNESDLWQIYNGIVKIKGNLYVKNITLQPKAKLFVAEEEVLPDIRSIYWMKNTTQSIPVHFEAQKGVRLPDLFTNKLNDIDFKDYMLNKDEDRLQTNYHFENITVLGDVLLDPNAKHAPNLTKVNEESVKTTGTFYISGKKTYTNILRVGNLETPLLGGVAVSDIFDTKSVNVTGKKTFKNIIVKGNLSCNIKSLEFINEVNITHFLENAIHIDEPQNLEKLHFKNITVKNVWITKLNNHQVNHYIQNVDKFLVSDKIESLTIDGNVILKTVTGVSKINDIDFEKLMKNNWKHGKYGILVNLQFFEPIQVGNLLTSYLNHINLRKIIKRLLYRHFDQNITAPYSFKNIKTENLVVSKINGISLENLIDVSNTAPQTIYAPGGIEFTSVILQKSLNANETSPCNLVKTLKKIREPPSQNWSNIQVKGNVTLLDPNSVLYRIFEKAVTINSKNIIQAPVEFSRHVKAENVFTAGLVNGINITEMMEDAVLIDPNEEQIITGRKVLPTLRVAEAVVFKNTDIPVVNNIEIPKLDKVIVQKNDIGHYVISGKKTFLGGLQCNKFYSEKVSDVDVDKIVTTENLRTIPQAIFDAIEVENLNISSINSVDFDGFLKTRLLTRAASEQTVNGVYFFDSIRTEHMGVPSINNITMDNVVFDIGHQNIFASKRFTQPVDIFGNLTCQYVNGTNISEIYKKSIKEDDTIRGSLTLLRPSVVKGSITTEYINGYPIEKIKETLNQGTITSETQKIRHIQRDIISKIKRNIDHIKFLASDYMYIEKTQVLQISVPDTISASTVETKGYVLIHVNGEKSGEHCGLAENCKCPVHYSIEVSPEHSVSIFPDKGLQRIFTYSDDGIIIHLLTNSFSTDSKCRSENAKVMNEVSGMTWNTLPNVNETGSFHQYDQFITGYISGAEFFTLRGQTYAIIGRYYDPTIDSHDLNCYVIKFNNDKSKAEKIQEIPARGAWSVYLFHTAQGIILIIGNIKTANTHQVQEKTQIYRFNENIERFELLRTVPSYGCSMATGVVLGTDSLIVLAHRYKPLQILKYNPNGDNYYSYQSFALEAPVVGISVFYTGGFGISDAYLCTVTANENYFVYSFRFIEGWKLESSGELEGLRNFIPFELNKQSYLFAPSSRNSSLLTVVKHGSV